MKAFVGWIKLLRDAAKDFGKNDPLILASSTAFFTVFSLAPIIIIAVNTLSWYFLNSKEVSQSFFKTIQETFGEELAKQFQEIVNNFQDMGGNIWITVIQFVFFIFIGTNLFKIVRTSINRVWNVRKSNTKNGFLIKVRTRAIALGLLLFTGILFLLSNFSDVVINALAKPISEALPDLNFILVVIASKVVSLIIITLWFAVLFRFLPDAKFSWKTTLTGAFLTSVLFAIGKFALEELLINGNVDDIFEKSSSIVLLLLFIFYSSMIMYFGACFVKVFAHSKEERVNTKKYAETYTLHAETKE